ncbi:MAG TPA: ABC transporter permease [Actinomycetes bacterium]|nr:ABC transporter permease [Actinomycetes bacterium]
MSERPRSGRTAAAALGALFAAPLVVLPVQAVADAWRAPALLPQRLGTRGLQVALTGQAGSALVNSLGVAVATTALALLLGWPAARALGGHRLRRPTPVLVVLAMPLLVPAYATGTGLAEWFVRLGLAGSRLGLILAHLTVVLPYVVLLLAAGFDQRLGDLEDMARTMGLGTPRRLALVTLPTVFPTLAAAALLGFLVSWSQYGLSLAIGGGLPMLPLVLLPFIRTDPQVAAALALEFLAPALAALAVAARASRRQILTSR